MSIAEPFRSQYLCAHKNNTKMTMKLKKAFRIVGVTVASIIGVILIGYGVITLSSAEKFEQPVEIASIENIDGQPFEGVLYRSTTRDRAVIVVSGSDGGIAYASKVAEVLAGNGITSLAVAYWGTERTPQTLSLIPVETVQSAAGWLVGQGYSSVGIYGFSKGAEYALTAASLLPQIGFVVAVVPSSNVFEGLAKPNYSGAASWTWQGEPLPYVSFDGATALDFKKIWANGEFGFRGAYLDALARHRSEENTIKVERINGPILLLSAADDAQWPSEEMGAMISKRLEEKQFPFAWHHEVYTPASHMLVPVGSPLKYIYKRERQQPTECHRAREEALKLTVQWIQNL